MGKYDEYTTKADTNQVFLLEGIANELAEINRLTRLQIRLNQGLLTARAELKEELEDQA